MSSLLVCSTGGHLSELVELAKRMPGLERPLRWVTFPTPQSEALLSAESVNWAAYTGQRDYLGIARNVPLAVRLLNGDVSTVVSTGAAIALSFLPLAAARGLDVHYVEGIARTDGPSVTGRVIERIPRARLYTQWPHWAGRKWIYRGSVFEAFAPGEPRAVEGPLRRVVVMLGTMPYSFRRLVDRLMKILPEDVDVLWQVGSTPVDDLPITAHPLIAPDVLNDAILAADVVIGHAGGGSALQVMGAGKCPVIVPREAAYNEHVDDHQLQITRLLPQRGLAVGARVDELTIEHLHEAARRRIVTVGDPPDFQLS